jgi:hypothetical protein
MITIYCICDCDGKKYVGSTKKTLKERLRNHKKKNNKCSSRLLNLKDCEIFSLTQCCEEERKETEQFFINKIDCVNTYKLDYTPHTKPETSKRYRENHREMIRERQRKFKQRERDYQRTWGGVIDSRRYNDNNLLQISMDLFS